MAWKYIRNEENMPYCTITPENDEKELRRINRDQNVFSVDNDKYYV